MTCCRMEHALCPTSALYELYHSQERDLKAEANTPLTSSDFTISWCSWKVYTTLAGSSRRKLRRMGAALMWAHVTITALLLQVATRLCLAASFFPLSFAKERPQRGTRLERNGGPHFILVSLAFAGAFRLYTTRIHFSALKIAHTSHAHPQFGRSSHRGGPSTRNASGVRLR